MKRRRETGTGRRETKPSFSSPSPCLPVSVSLERYEKFRRNECTITTSRKWAKRAPNFQIAFHRRQGLHAEDYAGKHVILYFYPKDDTPGCTKEACGFRDRIGDIEKAGAAVVGVSTDNLKSHEKFRQKYSLNFPLLSDQTADVSKMFGAWKEKNLYGRRAWGVARKTILIGPDGLIRRIYNKVSPEEQRRIIGTKRD